MSLSCTYEVVFNVTCILKSGTEISPKLEIQVHITIHNIDCYSLAYIAALVPHWETTKEILFVSEMFQLENKMGSVILGQ